MFTDEFESKPCACALQERAYRITLLGRSQFLIPRAELNQTDRDILRILIPTWDWTNFGYIRANLKYMGKWGISCILSYLISLGYVQERITY